MPGPLLVTKLHVPRRPRSLVPRPRLSDRLTRGAESALTLVSAPAGFGKTTLLTEWLAATSADGRSVAWLSLDQRDNDPVLFWTYFVAALRLADERLAAEAIGAGALSLLESPQSPIEAVLATLLNDLGSLANEVVLVLDDYHLIESRDVQDAMAFLVEHLPPQIHLVIAGRADPALPLPRLRGRGELVEIRAAELRFTPEEAASYLNEVMGLALTADDVAALEGRTEGWIAALQLAALSMQGRDDLSAFIAGFAGDDRYIVDYLAEEVLQRQPAAVKRFLLQTSILDRLCGPLCDAVTGQDGGKAELATLERGNLFLAPLDDRRQWYRYHQLFADVLQAHLLDEQPETIPALHQRASVWFEQNGEPNEAIRHALVATDFERAAGLVELAIPAMRRGRREVAMRGWLEALPDEVIRTRPVLCVHFAGVLLISGEIEGVEGWLGEAERWLGTTTGPRTGIPSEMVVVDEEEFRRLPGSIEVYRAALALAQGDGLGTVEHAERALELALEDDHVSRAAAAGLLGLAAWASGDLEAAHSAYTDCSAGLLRAGFVTDTFGCAIALADIRLAQGRLGDAMRTYEHALKLSIDEAGSLRRGTADMYVGMSEVHLERDDLPAAKQALLRNQELGERTGFPQNPYRWRVAAALIREAEADVGGALDLLAAAERMYTSDFFPNVRPISALRARALVTQDELGEALGWVRERGLSVDDELSYLREFEHVTLARLLLARAATEPAETGVDELGPFLKRLLRAAEDGGRTRSAIEIRVLQALAHQARGDVPAALASLEPALTLAEPEGYVRVFVAEGPPMMSLLKAAAKKGITPAYVRRLLGAGTTQDSRPTQHGLVEPLSERELDVLRLLGSELDGPDIARQLFVSLNTVRSHTKNIYAKLGVNNRRAAVRRAEELGL